MKFDVRSLGVDLTKVVPPRADITVLTDVFKASVASVSQTGDFEFIKSFCDGIGETRTRGVCRRLSNRERAVVIDALLPEVDTTSNGSEGLVQKLLDTVPNAFALHEVMEQVGFHRFEEGPAKEWFGERAALAQAIGELEGEESLIEAEGDVEKAEASIERIEEILRHNAEVFEAHGDAVQCLPFAMNARKLLEEFEIASRIGIDDSSEFSAAWNERIKLHTTTGLAVFDRDDLKATSVELRELREAFERFPVSVILTENVVIDVEFRACPPENPGALGGYQLGRIKIFDGVRTAERGVDYPDLDCGAMTYATVHEGSHTAHTICMSDFEKLSGWVDVRNYEFEDPATGKRIALDPSSWEAGKPVEIGGVRYGISFYQEPREISFPMGDDPIKFANPYDRPGTGYLYRLDAGFVSPYAKMQPVEDYAETLTHFILCPQKLQAAAPEKYEFMKYLYGKA